MSFEFSECNQSHLDEIGKLIGDKGGEVNINKDRNFSMLILDPIS